MRNNPPLQPSLTAGFDASITFPKDGNKYHLIKHEQFEEIMKIEQPKSLLTATGCLMYALGDLRNQLSLLDRPRIEDKISLVPQDLLFLFLFACAIVAAIFFGIAGFRSKSKREQILAEIASRNPVNFDPEKLQKVVIK